MGSTLPQYYQLRTGLSRGQEDGTAKKFVCTEWLQYFCLRADGLLESVNVFDDGFIYRSHAAPFTVPQRAEPSTAEQYAEVLARCLAKEKAAAEQLAKEKTFKKLLASGNIYGSLRADDEPAAPAEARPFLSDFTVIDLEFQGTSILELAARRYINWEPVGELVTFVRYTGPISSIVTHLTGITRADVANAPDEKQVLQWFRALAGDSLLICHNITADRRILEATRTRMGAGAPLGNPWLCTLALAKLRRPGQSHKLGDLCREAGISTKGAHRAANDVTMCAELLRVFHAEQPVGPESLYGAPVAKRPTAKRKATAEQGALLSSAAA